MPWIDWAKALAMIAVLMNHAGPFVFIPADPIDQLLSRRLISFNVPLFLIVSGYLHATTTPLTARRLGARLRRVLVPYLIATVVVTLFGLSPDATWNDFGWNLALGNACGPYYYVFVWCGCVVTGLVWSRLGASGLLVALALVTLATEWRTWHPPTYDIIWNFRDPLMSGWWVAYLLGWCARRFGWLEVVVRYPTAAVLFAIAGSIPWLVHPITVVSLEGRLLYTVSVTVALVALARGPVPLPIRWISRETLGLYLMHLPIMGPFVQYAVAWPPAARIAFAVSLTLGICAIMIETWRRVQHAWLGAPATEERMRTAV